jgi:hypothetical protein
LDVEIGGMNGYPPWRTTRRLIAPPTFDVSAVVPCTILSLDADGEEPPLEVQFWRELALKVEGLQVNDQVEFAFSSHWPHQRAPRDQSPRTYRERWIARAIYSMSRQPPVLRIPPAVEGRWGEYEKLCYSEMLRQVHRR